MSDLTKQVREEYTWKDGHDDFVQPIIDPNVIALCDEHERLEAAISGAPGDPRALLTANILRWPQEEREAFARHLLGADAPGRWIPVTERLPEEAGRYLTVCTDGNVDTCWFDEHEFTEYDGYGTDVTHWRPLPKPPEVDDDEESRG